MDLYLRSRMPEENWKVLEEILIKFYDDLQDVGVDYDYRLRLMLAFAHAYVWDRDAEYHLVFALVEKVMREN